MTFLGASTAHLLQPTGPGRAGTGGQRYLLRMPIYTKTGDKGDTGFFGGGRVGKDDIRVTAYGEIDELNAVIGGAMACEPRDFEASLLESIQRDLFSIGGQLATPDPGKVARAIQRADLPEGRVRELEAVIDTADRELEPLKAFILPGVPPKPPCCIRRERCAAVRRGAWSRWLADTRCRQSFSSI